MPEHSVKSVSLIVRNYFDAIKKTKFIFDVISVKYDEDDNEWTVECEVSNVFEEEPRQYTVIVDDETGDITDVSEISD